MTDDAQRVLRNFIAIERDRQLGYLEDELHMDPKVVILQALEVLAEEYGDDPDEIVWPDDQESLGIEDGVRQI